MFVIEGMAKVRKVIEENRKRKLTKHKKLPNNTIIEIDHCSPLEILKLQKNLMRIAEGEGIRFVLGKRKHKPEIQKLYEELEECGTRLMGYKECFEIMGNDRNSYSKTDLENRPGSNIHADERRLYDERAAKTSIQCPDRSRELLHYPRVCEQ